VPDDVKRLAVPVLGQRVVPAVRGALDLAPGADAGEALVADLVEAVPVPA